jgi:hypothetical protein
MMIQARLDINRAKKNKKTKNTQRHTNTNTHTKKTQNPDYSRNQGIVQK